MAPFGYTKAGKPRKRPVGNKKLEGCCPVKECQRSFKHRPNPRDAIWQHLAYYRNPMCAEFLSSSFRQVHIKMHEKMKAESKSKRLTESEKKERQKENKRKWLERNKEKRVVSLQKSNLKKKAKRLLIKEGKELTEKAIEEIMESL